MVGYKNLKKRAKKKLKSLLVRYRGYRLHELPKLEVSFENEKSDPRINLVLLGARKESAFGGTDTALRFFDAIRSHYRRSRIIVLQEDDSDHDPERWPGREIETRDSSNAHTVVYLKQRDFRLRVVNECDHFIATHWITAHYVIALREAQVACDFQPVTPFIYLIQDFEPGFYPWSSRYLLASATYTKPNETIAVFNTDLLREYVETTGYNFPAGYVFEPKLNPVMARYKGRLQNNAKRRLILVYGRPGAARNAFELIVEALSVFAERYGNADKWEILSLGEAHGSISLPNGLKLKSRGKVTLDQYAQYLLDASVGLSLMVSPHPSYPPLEMAEFGIRVITNKFANKNLSERSDNIISLSDTRPSALASALIEACDAFETYPIAGNSRPAFLGAEDEFPFDKELASRLLSSRGMGSG